MYIGRVTPDFSGLFSRRPKAFAKIKGSDEYSEITGNVWFYESPMGVLTVANIKGLPSKKDGCGGGVFGFHIHTGGSCEGDAADPFSQTQGHYDPEGCEHPYHAGDMPPLFENNGEAFLAFVSNRFGIDEIIGRTVVIHSNADDFTTQPSGNSGKKIACGEIKE